MHATGAIVGEALGAGDVEEARQTGRVASVVTTAAVLAVTLDWYSARGRSFDL